MTPLPDCPCACCADQRHRHAHGRDIGDTCTCAGHAPAEQCDCAYCARLLASRTLTP